MMCPLCAYEKSQFAFKRKDGLSTYLCPSCKLRFVPQQEHESLYGSANRLYDRAYYQDKGDIGFKGYEERSTVDFLWQRAFIEIIEKTVARKRVLDVGCGTGKLLELLREHGARAGGIEISDYAARVASNKGFTVFTDDFLSFPEDSPYDIITAFDLLEHIPDTRAFLRKVRNLLDNQGAFIFMTPDAGSRKALAECENWYGYKSSLEHIYYFSTSSLRYAFKETFGNEPILYQAAAADGEGILGFIRKNPDESDAVVNALFEGNFPLELVNDRNFLQVCTLLMRLGDERFRIYAQKFITEIMKSEKREAIVLRSQIEISTSHKTSTKGILIRPYREGDEYGIISLFKEVFGREMSIDEWHWKYKGQGNDAVSAVVAINDAGRIVGHYGGIPLRTIYHGELIHILATCDVMIHPSCRGFWMLKRITTSFKHEAVKRGFRMCYGFPTEKTLMLPAEKIGIIERCTNVFDACKDVSFHNNLNRFLFKLFPINFDDPRIDSLWQSAMKDRPFSVIRDTEYVVWRYGRNSRFRYDMWGLTRRWDKQLLGAAILRNKDLDDLMLMDVVCKDDILVPLLQKVENLAFSMKKKSISLWMPERYHEKLYGNGYILKKKDVLGQIVGQAFIPKDTIAKDFFFSRGDTDYL